MEFTEEYLDFVKIHAKDDPDKLRLRYHEDSRPWLAMAIDNVAALKKRGKFKLDEDTDLTPEVIPVEISAQQATSARIARLHSELVGESQLILDMTFGLGMDARFLAVDADKHILGFDLKEELVAAAKINYRQFPNINVKLGDSVRFLETYDGEPFDLIFIDPARRGEQGKRLYNLHDCQPDLIDILPLIKRNSHRLTAKLSPMLDVTQTIRDLPGISELHIIEEGGECKELLAIIDFDKEATTPAITIDRLVKGKLKQFSFNPESERNCQPLPYRLPKVGEYILEPSAATMKAAPFNLLSSDFSISPLHPNTHLYISQTDIEEFPGSCRKIIDQFQLTSSNIKRLGRLIKSADIAVRNLKGFTPETLRKRLKISQGGDLRLYAVTAATPLGDAPMLILTKL